MTVDDYGDAAHAYLHDGQHPTLGRAFHALGYLPMVELLRYLEAHGFTNYIASGGDRDFMRPVTEQMYGIPPERVIGSSNALAYQDDEHGGSVVYLAQLDFFDDGPVEARPHLEPHRPPADPRGRQLERRHPDAPLRRGQGRGPRSACCCSTTTPSASSTTPPAPRSPSSRQPPRDGPSSASRTTGPSCSETLPAEPPNPLSGGSASPLRGR